MIGTARLHGMNRMIGTGLPGRIATALGESPGSLPGSVATSLPGRTAFWEDVFHKDGIESQGQARGSSPERKGQTQDNISKSTVTTEELRSRFENFASQGPSASYGPITPQQGPTRSSFTDEESLETSAMPMVSNEEEWHDISPSGRPNVISPVLQPRLETPTKDPAKVVEI